VAGGRRRSLTAPVETGVSAARSPQGHFSGSSDVTAVSIPGTGHHPMFERTLPQFRAIFANWLTAHELGG
jgi:pimeloyl-ACP methyl ester carboxylesterase